MRIWSKFLIIAGLSLLGPRAFAAHTEARLLLADSQARPGETVMAGIQLRMEPLWHTYWRNPGDSGMATTVEWQLPPGVTAGEIQWPAPEKVAASDLTTYNYENEVVLLVPLTLASNLPPGPLDLKAHVSWLECQEQCLPADQEVTASLTVAPETKPSANAAVLADWLKKMPLDGSALGVTAHWEAAISTNSRPVVLEWSANTAPPAADFFAYASDNYETAPTTKLLSSANGKVRLQTTITKTGGDWPKEIPGLLIVGTGGKPDAYTVNVPVTDAGPAAAGSPATTDSGAIPAAAAAAESLWVMLGLAFLGGLILNIMPCVFPVIALKILGFVQHREAAPGRVFRLGLVYSLGVLVSFMVLAGLVIGVQQAGGAASWGMQLQNPQFSLALLTLVLLVALNLFGVFEVTLSGRAMNAAGSLTAKEGTAGAFFNGVLATALATPCTAPFLAPALGFAFAQPPAIIVLFFAVIAAGLSTPYLILSWKPAWLKFLPRPGAWMEKFKIAMGFPMLATAIWLFSFTAKRFGADGPLWVGLFLVVTALAAWVWGEFVQRGRRHKGLAWAITLLLLGTGYGYALEGQLHWRTPAGAGAAAATTISRDGLTWQKWSPEAVAQARAAGHPVLVDFTADWCLTCQLNKRSSIEVPEVEARLRDLKAVTLIGDNTDKDPAIIAELKKFERAGVPLVLVYPRNTARPPLVLPAFLTKGIMLDALNTAAE